jgi:hypothetical protein
MWALVACDASRGSHSTCTFTPQVAVWVSAFLRRHMLQTKAVNSRRLLLPALRRDVGARRLDPALVVHVATQRAVSSKAAILHQEGDAFIVDPSVGVRCVRLAIDAYALSVRRHLGTSRRLSLALDGATIGGQDVQVTIAWSNTLQTAAALHPQVARPPTPRCSLDVVGIVIHATIVQNMTLWLDRLCEIWCNGWTRCATYDTRAGIEAPRAIGTSCHRLGFVCSA